VTAVPRNKSRRLPALRLCRLGLVSLSNSTAGLESAQADMEDDMK
jgi:hypothetical protein